MKVELRHKILSVLAREGASSPSRIAEEVGVTRQAVLNSLNRLLKRGWVERVDRGVYVTTEEGKRVVEKMALIN
jgi:predicted transcriptional regulator